MRLKKESVLVIGDQLITKQLLATGKVHKYLHQNYTGQFAHIKIGRERSKREDGLLV